MVGVAADHGYDGATVARVAARAGVSRATFYEHFNDREDCFLAAYRVIAFRLRASLEEATLPAEPPERVEAIIDTLLATVEDDPVAARFLFVASPTASPAVRAEHGDFLETLEIELEAVLVDCEGRSTVAAPAAGLVAGVDAAISIRLLENEAESMQTIGRKLISWVESYRLPNPLDLATSHYWDRQGRGRLPPPVASLQPVKLLPRGQWALPATEAAAARRARILAALVGMLAKRDYRSLTVSEIVSAARVPRTAFYSHFKGKEEALLAAQTVAMQQSMAITAAELSLSVSWPERIWRGCDALLCHLTRQPELAHLQMVADRAAGPGAIRQSYRSRMAHAVFLADGYREGGGMRAPSSLTSEAVPAAVCGLMRRHLLQGHRDLRSLLPAAVYIALAPFIGAAEALQFIEGKGRRAG
jgi:AcrR family transcriptional regulator